MILAKLANLFAKAISQGDVRAALAVLREEAQLHGLYDEAKKKALKPKAKKPVRGKLKEFLAVAS